LKTSIKYLILCVQLLYLINCSGPKSWQKVSEGDSFGNDDLNTRLLGAIFYSRNNGWAISYNHLMRTDDKGKSFKFDDKYENMSYTSINSNYSTTLWITGSEDSGLVPTSHGFILTTNIAGDNWKKIDIPSVASIHQARICSPNTIWAVGYGTTDGKNEYSKIIKSTDGGQKWDERYREKSSIDYFHDISCGGYNDLLAISTTGNIINTLDGGNSWQKRELSVGAFYARVHHFGPNAWIVGGNGTILKSIDQGRSWQQIHCEIHKGLSDILMIDDRGWIVGENGLIISTQDAGIHWNVDKSNTKSNLYSLSLSEDAIWAVGENGTVLRLQFK
jgi:photosystem II stability/assembly factor-like uncharacterized protein